MDPIYITLVNQPTKKIGDKREKAQLFAKLGLVIAANG